MKKAGRRNGQRAVSCAGMNIHSLTETGRPLNTDVEKKRDIIQRAALRLFDAHGFRGTSMAAIAEEAQVGAGTIYRYFDGKEDLVHQLYREARKKAHRSILSMGFDEDASVRDRLYTLWRAVILDYIDCPQLYRFILKYESSGYSKKSVRAQTEDLKAPFRELYRDGVEQGLFRSLPRSIFASFFTGTVTHLVQEHLNGGTQLDDAYIDQTFEMLWAAFTIEPPPSDPP